MITTDQKILRLVSSPTTIEECEKLDIFNILEKEFLNSDTEGVGLAAIQIEMALRVCIIRYEKLKLNMINPVIENKSLPVITSEGCLSLPGIQTNTQRYTQVTVKWLDYDSKEEQRAVFYGAEAIVVQHEIDHMDGILMIDRKAIINIKIGRNELCPCGSGKKYKKCCLK